MCSLFILLFLTSQQHHPPSEEYVAFGKHSGGMLSATEVSVAQFTQFCVSTGYKTHREMLGAKNSAKPFVQATKGPITWKNPGILQKPSHPVVWVTLADAKAYCKWLSKNDDQFDYRVPKKAEWLAATHNRRRDFENNDRPERYVNVRDSNLWNVIRQEGESSLNDGFAFTSPVTAKKRGLSGLRNMHGNVSEICEADREGKCAVCGGSWFDPLSPLNYHFETNEEASLFSLGFRVLRIRKEFK